MDRREYAVLHLVVNGIQIDRVIIDSHYEEKHSLSVTNEIILALVWKLNGSKQLWEDEKNPFYYFHRDQMELAGKLYRLVWLLEAGKNYLGVVNAHRR